MDLSKTVQESTAFSRVSVGDDTQGGQEGRGPVCGRHAFCSFLLAFCRFLLAFCSFLLAFCCFLLAFCGFLLAFC